MLRNTSILITVMFLLLSFNSSAQTQTISQRLTQAVKQFQSDPQMRHAIMSICVIDAKTGKKVFAHNDQIGLAPASTQKIFISAAAFELLGHNYSFKTELAYSGKISNGILSGDINIIGNGDPSLGSWRFNDTKEEVVLTKWVNAIKEQKIKTVKGFVLGLIMNDSQWTRGATPDGWIWQDIGNYYGAAAEHLNWRENQYDLVLRPGSFVGDSVHIVGTRPKLVNFDLANQLRTAAKNTGDNAYIYFPVFGSVGLVRGTIPMGEKEFVISGAMRAPYIEVSNTLEEKIKQQDITFEPMEFLNYTGPSEPKIIHTHFSPPLDTLNFHFMRRSINLYGEAFLKIIALEKSGIASTEKGVELLQDFYSKIGIDKGAINILDGSGLSPQNRVTTDAQVKVLQFAKNSSWFPSFYHAFPLYNGMKMKSGSIGGARAYAGYHTAKDGKEYIFSIIVNNYDGSGAEATRKLFKVLDVLK